MFAAIAISALLQFGMVTLPLTREVFDIPATFGRDWLFILVLSLVPVTVIELSKVLRQWISTKRSTKAISVA